MQKQMMAKQRVSGVQSQLGSNMQYSTAWPHGQRKLNQSPNMTSQKQSYGKNIKHKHSYT